MQINDLILTATGGPTLNEGLSAWFGRTPEESLQDAEYRFITTVTGSTGDVQDLWFEYLRGLGYTGALSDMFYQYWSSGGTITVPNLVGLTLAAATDAITGAGLTLGTVTGTTDPVLSQDPAAGAEVAPYTAIDLTMTA